MCTMALHTLVRQPSRKAVLTCVSFDVIQFRAVYWELSELLGCVEPLVDSVEISGTLSERVNRLGTTEGSMGTTPDFLNEALIFRIVLQGAFHEQPNTIA